MNKHVPLATVVVVLCGGGGASAAERKSGGDEASLVEPLVFGAGIGATFQFNSTNI